MTDFILSLALILSLTFGGWYFATSNAFSDEVTVYNLWCSKERVNGECLEKEEAANPIRYKAFVQQQTVMYWFEGDKPTKLNNCVVRDYQNWSCESHVGERFYNTYMIDGYIHEDYSQKVTSLFYQGPRWKWLLLNLKMKLE
jgi:hypothetical protein